MHTARYREFESLPLRSFSLELHFLNKARNPSIFTIVIPNTNSNWFRIFYWALATIFFIVLSLGLLYFPFSGIYGEIVLRTLGATTATYWRDGWDNSVWDTYKVATIGITSIVLLWPLLFKRSIVLALIATLIAYAPLVSCMVFPWTNCGVGGLDTDGVVMANYVIGYWFFILLMYRFRRLPWFSDLRVGPAMVIPITAASWVASTYIGFNVFAVAKNFYPIIALIMPLISLILLLRHFLAQAPKTR